MRKKWVVCMIACLTILLAGCNGNTAKETARNDTDKRISSTAGNTETTTETEKADDTTSVFRKQSNRYQVKQQQSRVSRKSRLFLLRQVNRKLQKTMIPFR